MKSPQRKTTKSYEIERSPLYKLSNKRKLAELLNVDLVVLTSLRRAGLTTQYRIFKDRTSRRFITEPIRDLAAIHKRLLNLLRRIAPPEYVHSARKKHSYKTNAEQHRNSENILKIDIKSFFPSVKFNYIYEFFRSALCCAPDVATILAKLCTVETAKYGSHLPTGSCISPLLSFLANRPLFDEIASLCAKSECVFTLYVDDVTVSGKSASRALLTQIAMTIHKHGYGYHKIKTYEKQPATVTGLVINRGKLCLPHERAQKIRELSHALSVAKGALRPKMLSSLVGRLSEAEQIDPAYRVQRRMVMAKYSKEWGNVVAERAKKACARRVKT